MQGGAEHGPERTNDHDAQTAPLRRVAAGGGAHRRGRAGTGGGQGTRHLPSPRSRDRRGYRWGGRLSGATFWGAGREGREMRGPPREGQRDTERPLDSTAQL